MSSPEIELSRPSVILIALIRLIKSLCPTNSTLSLSHWDLKNSFRSINSILKRYKKSSKAMNPSEKYQSSWLSWEKIENKRLKKVPTINLTTRQPKTNPLWRHAIYLKTDINNATTTRTPTQNQIWHLRAVFQSTTTRRQSPSTKSRRLKLS